MSNNISDPELLLSDPSFSKFNSLGLIDPIALRNYIIKSEYKELRKTETQIESISLLSEKYFLSYDAINTILFRPRIRLNPSHGACPAFGGRRGLVRASQPLTSLCQAFPKP